MSCLGTHPAIAQRASPVTLPTFAPPINNPVDRIDDPTYVAVRDRLDPAILAGYSSVGFPGIVVPMGRGSHGLPIAGPHRSFRLSLMNY